MFQFLLEKMLELQQKLMRPQDKMLELQRELQKGQPVDQSRTITLQLHQRQTQVDHRQRVLLLNLK